MHGTAALLLLMALAAPAAADVVHLVNGNKFEQVVAERADGMVRIRLPQGEIVLPEKLVARVESAPSAWQAYAERAAALGAESAASDWFELARWAETEGYPRGAREALLRAAELEPGLAGLAPWMARIGHLRDGETGRWLSEDEAMRRRGYKRWGEQWLASDEYAARLRAQQQAETSRREDARQDRISRALEALVAVELSRSARAEPPPAAARGPLVAVYSGAYFAFGAVGRAGVPLGAAQTSYDDLVDRQPGSLFPIRPSRHLTRAD